MRGAIKKYIYILIFTSLLVAPSIAWGILSVLNISDPSIMKRLDFDLNEKRLKAMISETIDLNTINIEYENYYNDRIPFRSILITLKKSIDGMIEEPYKNGIEKVLLKVFSKKKEVTPENHYRTIYDDENYRCFDQAVDLYFNHALKKTEIDEYESGIDYPQKLSDNQLVLIGQSDWLYLFSGNIDYYIGSNTLSTDSEIKERVDTYIQLNDLCKKTGKNLVIYICPEKEEIYSEYMPTYNIINTTELPIYISNYIDKNTDIKYIYPKDEFLSYKDRYILYKKFDSHWNSVGGFLAFSRIKEALGLDKEVLYDQTIEKKEDNYGDLIPYGNIPMQGLKPGLEYTFTEYKNDHEVKTEVVVDNFSSKAFISECDKGIERKVLLVGDSYTEALIPFAEKTFKKLYCTSYMNFTKDFIKNWVEDADDIVLVFVERNENVALKDVTTILNRILKNYEKKYEKEIAKLNNES